MNNKLKYYIVDDEERAINSLEFLLDFYCHDTIESIAHSSIYGQAISYLEKNIPDVLFLDINLGHASGFDLLKQLPLHPNTHLVIVTAYSEYALEAFNYNTVNYLLKPVDPEALQKTIERIVGRMAFAQQGSTLTMPQSEQFFYPTKHGYRSLSYNDIIYIKGDGSYANIHLPDKGVVTVSKNLSFFEHLFSNRQEYLRIHKSYIINKGHIKELSRQGGTKLIMSDGTPIPVSAVMKNEIFNMIR